MSRPFWSGDIHFGLVKIPITLHARAQARDFDVTLVDVRDFSPIRYQKINQNTGREVPPDKIVKTFPLPGGEAVVLTDADFTRVRPKGSKSLEISGVLRASEIPVQSFDTPYILEPDGQEVRAYVLLREALRRQRRVALAHGVL